MRYLLLSAVLLLLWGCGRIRGVPPEAPPWGIPETATAEGRIVQATAERLEGEFHLLEYDFVPIVPGKFASPKEALKAAVDVLKESGHRVKVNQVLCIAATHRENLGYQIWKKTNEKWKVSYEAAVQIIRSEGDLWFWNLCDFIVGSRSGKQDRRFDPSDFEHVERRFDELIYELTSVLGQE